jgi:hypothetical protein
LDEARRVYRAGATLEVRRGLEWIYAQQLDSHKEPREMQDARLVCLGCFDERLTDVLKTFVCRLLKTPSDWDRNILLGDLLIHAIIQVDTLAREFEIRTRMDHLLPVLSATKWFKVKKTFITGFAAFLPSVFLLGPAEMQNGQFEVPAAKGPCEPLVSLFCISNTEHDEDILLRFI